MSRAFKCDRCKEFSENGSTNIVIDPYINSFGSLASAEKLEVCSKCKQDFKKFMEENK